jgi:hypothetical protein
MTVVGSVQLGPQLLGHFFGTPECQRVSWRGRKANNSMWIHGDLLGRSDPFIWDDVFPDIHCLVTKMTLPRRGQTLLWGCL